MTGQQDEKSDMVWVPRMPTQAMIDYAWPEANEENAAGVWELMIKSWESTIQQGKFNNR